MHQTFLSESRLLYVRNPIQRGSLKPVPFPSLLEVTRLSMYFYGCLARANPFPVEPSRMQ